jgi:predicted enzyme related to lactoylglutathione lyase
MVNFMDHTIIHFEIPANDVEKMKKFYSDLFNWKIEKLPTMEYYSVTTVPMDEKGNLLRPGVNGGLYKKDQPQRQPLNYTYVESVDEYSKKIADLGGKILVTKKEVPGMGWFAVAQDPEGNTFGIFETIPM